MQKPICILEFPSNLGLKEPSPGHEPGVKKLPDWLRQYHFHDKLHAEKVYRLDPPAYSMELDTISGVRNADKLARYAKDQATVLDQCLNEDLFPVVIGGDCSILTGNMLGLKRRGRYGIFFLDGHTDFITPELSGTAGAAGMDLAIVAGHGHDKLTNIDGLKPYTQEEHIWCVGNREYDADYEQPVIDAAVEYYTLDRLRREGISSCVDRFLKMTEEESLDGFWIHIDVDVLNDDIMPAVDSRAEDGLSYNEFNEILTRLLSHPKVTGLELTILDPELDPDAKYTIPFVENFAGIFEKIRAT